MTSLIAALHQQLQQPADNAAIDIRRGITEAFVHRDKSTIGTPRHRPTASCPSYQARLAVGTTTAPRTAPQVFAL